MPLLLPLVAIYTYTYQAATFEFEIYSEFLIAFIRTFGGIATIYRAYTILDVVNLGA